MIRVVVVAEVRLYREAVGQALGLQRDLHLAGADDPPAQALTDLARHHPDVVLLDLGMPGALEALRTSATTMPDTRFIALGFGGSDADAIAAAQAGVSGYIGIHQPLDDVLTAIRDVMRGEAPCDGRIAAALLRRMAIQANDPGDEPLSELTSRERRILELVAHGLSNKEIAGELVIGVATVKSHVHAILHKLGVSRRGAAADMLRRSQLVGVTRSL